MRDMAEVAPMLAVLGYDPHANPPNYGKPETFVMEKMKKLASEREEWEQKEQELIRMRESIRSNLVKGVGNKPISGQQQEKNGVGLLPDS